MASRAGTVDTALQKLRQELEQALTVRTEAADQRDVDRRRAPRAVCSLAGSLRVGELVVSGKLTNVSAGGAFLRVDVLVEVGELGAVSVEGHTATVKVAWLRGAAHPEGPGMGLMFVKRDHRDEAAALGLALVALRDG